MDLSPNIARTVRDTLGVTVRPEHEGDQYRLTAGDCIAVSSSARHLDVADVDLRYVQRLLSRNVNGDGSVTFSDRDARQMLGALDRIRSAKSRRDKLDLGIIPGALSSSEVTRLVQRGFLR